MSSRRSHPLSGDSNDNSVASSAAARGPLHPPPDAAAAASAMADASREAGDSDNSADNDDNNGWLVTSCDVGTTEPQSLSEELDRLQVLKSYHMMDPEREESFDRLTTLASRVLKTPAVFLSLVDMGRIWFRCNPESDTEEKLTRDLLGCISRVILKHNDVFVIPDIHLNENFRQQGTGNASAPPLRTSPNQSPFRFFTGAPLLSPEGYRLGAFCMLGKEPRPEGISEAERENLKDFAVLAVKSMVDRRKLTTQGNPSHLVAATAHDLITPLTGIQLSLSLLQQDGDFQAKLGDKRKEFLSGAVGSSNMMLRICQSTIETLRGNRKMPAATDWSLPRNLMQIAEASPFIDMKEFAANLEVISNSIPKRAPLKIILHPSTPDNIVSDGLKIFRAALNLLSNACSRTESGFITMTIQDDQDGFLLFECEDTGKDVGARDSQALFSQDSSPSNFGLYSVAYQVSWLGGKYGVRKRDSVKPPSSGDLAAATRNNGASRMAPPKNLRKSDKNTGAVFWFCVPIVLPQDVSELMGLAKSLTDSGKMTGVPTFKADLPQTPPASPLVDTGEGSSDSPHIPTGVVTNIGETNRTLNALIIEDSTTVRKILGRALSKLGYQVFEAVDGMEGLRELKVTLFDIVLCDFLMPVMDGLDCVQQYREWEVTNRQTVRQYIIGISAHASRKDIERGLKLGMDDFKPKPIVLKTLKGLHESLNLKAVRSKLDNLLNLPSLMVQEHDPVDTSRLSEKANEMVRNIGLPKNGTSAPPPKAPLFAIPAKKLPSKNSALFSIATKLVENETKKAALLSTSVDSEQKKVKKPPLFSIATNLTEMEAKKTALFSISTNLTQEEPRKPALFSIPSGTAAGGAVKGESEKGALFAIPADRKPGALFSVAKTTTSKQDGEAQRETKNPALFSIAPNLTSPEAGQTKKQPALFALPSNANEKSEAKPAPLFALPDSTSDSASDKNKKNPGALFAISTTSTQRDSAMPGISNAPLFAISGTSTKSEMKRAPLFSIPSSSSVHKSAGESKSTEPAAKPALFELPGTAGKNETEKKAPLLSIPPTSLGKGDIEGTKLAQSSTKPAALFDVNGSGSDKSTTTTSKSLALFDIPGTSSSTGVGHEATEGERRGKKRPLFDIPMGSKKK